LGTSISRDNVLLTANMTNRPLQPLGDESVGTPKGVLHLEKCCLLWSDRLYMAIVICNYGERAAHTRMSFHYEAGFRDIFEIRGRERARRGEILPPKVGDSSVVLHYRGLDEKLRCAALSFSLPPQRMSGECAEFDVELAAGARMELYAEVGADTT